MATIHEKLHILLDKLKETDHNLSVCVTLLQQYLRKEILSHQQTVLSILIIWTAMTNGKHHKKKGNQGIFGYATSLYEDFVPNISKHILKFAVDRLTDHEEEEEQDFGGNILGSLIGGGGGGGGGKHKHHHHHHQKGQVVYKPVYVGPENYAGYNDYYQPPNHAGLYPNYQHVPNNFHAEFPSGLNTFNNFDDFNYHHVK